MKAVFLTILALLASTTQALIVCTDSKNDACLETIHTEALFAKPLDENAENGIRGRLLLIKGGLCDVSEFPQFPDNTIPVVSRGACTFKEKALNAEKLGANAIVILDNEEEEKVLMMASHDLTEEETIPAVLIPSIESQLIVEYIETAAQLRENCYGLLFAGDDVLPQFGLFTFACMLYDNIIFFCVIVLVITFIRRVLCCGKSRSRSDHHELIEEHDLESSSRVLVLGEVAQPCAPPAREKCEIVLGVPLVIGDRKSVV